MNICNLGINYVREHLSNKPENGLSFFYGLLKKIKEAPLNDFLTVPFKGKLETYATLELKHTAVLYRGLEKQNSLSIEQRTLCEKISTTASLIVWERKNLMNNALYQGLKMSPDSWSKQTIKFLITQCKDLNEEEIKYTALMWKGVGYWINGKLLHEPGFTAKKEIKFYCRMMGENLKTLTMDISNIDATDLGEIVSRCPNIERLILRRQILEVLKLNTPPYDFSSVFDHAGSLKKLKIFGLYGHFYTFPPYTVASEWLSKLCKSGSIESLELIRMLMSNDNSFFNGLLNLESLKSLRLSHCKIFNTDFASFNNHPTLDTLILDECFINDYSEIETEHLEKVKELAISFNESLRKGSLETLKKCRNLEKLSFVACKEQDIYILVGFKRLKDLTIKVPPSGSPFMLTKQILSSLELTKETLEVLDINQCTIDCGVEDLIVCFDKFPRLKSVRIPFRGPRENMNTIKILQTELGSKGILFRNY